MYNNKLNIILFGAHYYGQMAPSQRVWNLFRPLVVTDKITLRNIVHYQDASLICDNDVEVAVSKRANRIVNALDYVRISLKMLDDWYYDGGGNVVYHYGNPALDSFLILLYARRKGYGVVFDIAENVYAFSNKNASILHKLNGAIKKYVIKKIGEIGDLCFGISDSLVRLCTQWTNGKIPVLSLPISVDVKKVNSYKKLQFEDKEISVFYGGSFAPKDGIPYLIEGFSKAWQQDKRLRLYLTGKIARESVGELEQLLQKSAAKEAITYLGCLPTDEYYGRMANSNILCMLRVNSLFANSGFPFKLGEYLASGNAVIATRTTDVEKYLINQKNAILIEPEQPQLIASAILTLARNNALRKKIGTAGQLVAKECFDAPQVADYMYRQIVTYISFDNVS